MKKLDISALKRSVILYISAAMMVLTAVTVAVTSYLQNYRIDVEEQRYNKQIHLGIEHVIEHYIHDYSYRALRILETEDTVELIKNRNREGLYKLFQPKWNLLLQEQKGLEIMHFHLANGDSFLRMHKPHHFGDNLLEKRPMIKEIHSKHKFIHGYETGKYGTSYRIIHPIFDENGSYIGALEIGLNATFILDAVHDINAFDGMVFIKETSLYLYSNADNVRIDGYELQSAIPLRLQAIVKELRTLDKLENSMEINTKEGRYKTHLFTLKDYKGDTQVKILFFQDTSDFGIFRQYLLVGLFLSLIVVLTGLIWLVYRKIGEYQKDVSKAYEVQLEKLNESEHRFQTLYEKAPEAYQSLDKNGDILIVNTKWTEDLGYTKEEVIGRNFSEFLAPGFDVKFRENFLKFGAAGDINNVEYEMLCKDGEIITVSFNGKTVKDDEENFQQTHCVFSNITEQKAIREKVEFHRKYLQTIFDVSSNIMITTDGRVIDTVNPAMLSFFGFRTLEEFKMEHDCICEFFLKGDEFLEAEMDGMNWLEYIFLNPKKLHRVCMLHEGERHHFTLEAHALNIDDSNRSMVFFSDVTEFEKLSQQLEYAVKGANDGLWDWNLEEDSIYFAPRWKEMLGYSDRELMNIFETWESRVHPDDLEEAKEQIEICQKNPDIEYKNTHRMRHKDGHWVWILDRGQVVFDSSGKAVRMVGFHTDITEIKELETQLRENEEIYYDFFEHTKSANIMYETDDDGKTFKIKNLNYLVEKLENVKREDIVGRRVDEVFSGVEEFGQLDIFRDVYKSGKPFSMPMSLYEDDKRVVWRENYIFRLSNGDIVASYEDRTKERELELLLNNIINSIENIIFVKDKNFKFIECNNAFEKFMQKPREEFIGKSDYDFFDKEFADGFRMSDKKVIESGEIQSNYEWIVQEDGSEVYLLTVKAPLRDSLGKVFGLVGNSVDMTAQKRLEDELRRSKQEFDLFMEYVPASIFIKDEGKHFIYANETGRDFFNHTDIIGLKAEELLSDEEIEYSNKIDETILQNGYYEEIQEFTNYDSEKRIYRLMGFKIEDENQAKIGTVIIDITDEFKAQYEVNKLKSALDRSPVSVMMTDVDGNIEYINPNYTRMSGYTLEEIRGKNPRIVQSGFTSDAAYEEMWQQISSGHIWTSDVKNIAKDGTEFWEDSTIIPSFDENDKVNGYIAFKLEITEKIHLQKELHDKEELMIAQSRHAAMGEMISMIAHQWRQPISVIAMDANNILADIELEMLEEGSLKSTSKDIIKQTQELSNTIDDFRNFFRPEKEAQEVRVQELFDDALAVIGKSLESSQVEFKLEIDESKKITTFSRELMQVFINIIKNAKEALIENEIENKKISVYTQSDDTFYELKICDNAGGVKLEDMQSIFDPYFTTKGQKNGTGLGLYMSKTIVEKHLQGFLSIENDEEGACFIIQIPHQLDSKE